MELNIRVFASIFDFSKMNADSQNTLLTDDDVREAYSKLRALTQEDFSTGEASAEAYLILLQISEQERCLTPEERERRANLALAEGLVDVFERAADWTDRVLLQVLPSCGRRTGSRLPCMTCL